MEKRYFLFEFTEESLFDKIVIKAKTEREAELMLKLTVNLNGCEIKRMEVIQ